jgi:hypothetical protein
MVMTSTVRIAWDKSWDKNQKWNEVCAWAINYFGLPGDRYQCRLGMYHMDFIFKSNKDALLMSLMWNAPVITNSQLTVEHIGSMING